MIIVLKEENHKIYEIEENNYNFSSHQEKVLNNNKKKYCI